MQDRNLYFISGQTRSGSELLSNILAQNPRFDATATSGSVETLVAIRNKWNQTEEHRATPNKEAQKRVMKAVLAAYHDPSDADVVFDKSRGWLAYMEMADYILDHRPKVLVPVRDLREVLSSWEKMYRRDAATMPTTTENTDYIMAQTTQGRADILLRHNGPVGIAHNRMQDAIQRGWAGDMFFIDYDDLTHEPEQVMRGIYDFLEEEYFEHDFDAVVQVTEADDSVYGFTDLHTIRPEVKPQRSDWEEILGDWALNLKVENFWKNNQS